MTKAPQAIADDEPTVTAEPAGDAVPVEAAPKRRGRPPGSGKNGNGAAKAARAPRQAEHRVVDGTVNVRLCITVDTKDGGRMVLDRQAAATGDTHDAVSTFLRTWFQDWFASIK